MNTAYQFNPGLDLTFERIVDVPKEFIWRALLAYITPSL
jgi:hypothetical protein